MYKIIEYSFPPQLSEMYVLERCNEYPTRFLLVRSVSGRPVNYKNKPTTKRITTLLILIERTIFDTTTYVIPEVYVKIGM